MHLHRSTTVRICYALHIEHATVLSVCVTLLSSICYFNGHIITVGRLQAATRPRRLQSVTIRLVAQSDTKILGCNTHILGCRIHLGPNPKLLLRTLQLLLALELSTATLGFQVVQTFY